MADVFCSTENFIEKDNDDSGINVKLRSISEQSAFKLQQGNHQPPLKDVANEMLISQMCIADKANYFKAFHAKSQREEIQKEKTRIESYKRRRRVGTESQFIPQYKLENTKLPKLMLLHFSRTRIVWDWLILLIVAYIAITVPYNVSFKRNADIYYTFLLDLFLELFFILDIIINFRTTFIQPQSGRLITDPKEIAKHYLKGWFCIDCLAVVPFEILYFANPSWAFIVCLLKLGRLLRLFRVGRRVSRYLEYTATLLILMMVSFGLLAHWFACIWYAIGYEELESGNTTGWLNELGKQMKSPHANGSYFIPTVGEKYISALYFVFTSLTTVGFGNIAPNTVAEKAFSVLVLLLGAIVQSAIFGNMTAVIQKLYAARARFHTKATEIKQFVRHHQIDGDLRRRIEDWFISHWSISKGVNTDEMLDSFPQELQADICLHLYKSFLTLPCFINASRGCLRSLSLKVRKAYISPGELIIKEKDAINSIFFVQRGTIEIVQRDYIVAILGTGDLFGEDISSNKIRQKSNGDVRALMYCDILYLTRETIKEVFQNYPDFSDHFSNNIGLAFDLGEKQRKQSMCNSSIGLDSIEEENEETDIHKTTSDSDSSNDDEMESTDDEQIDSRENKRKLSKRKNCYRIPLWQQKIRRQEMQKNSSPTVSLKNYLLKLESQSSDDEINKIGRDRSLSHLSSLLESTYVSKGEPYAMADAPYVSIDMSLNKKENINEDMVKPDRTTLEIENERGNNSDDSVSSDQELLKSPPHKPYSTATKSFEKLVPFSYNCTENRHCWDVLDDRHSDINDSVVDPDVNIITITENPSRWLSSLSLPDILPQSPLINVSLPSNEVIINGDHFESNKNYELPTEKHKSFENIYLNQMDGYLDADLGIYSQCSEFGSSYNNEKLNGNEQVEHNRSTNYTTQSNKNPLLEMNKCKNKRNHVEKTSNHFNEKEFKNMRGDIGNLRMELNDIKSSIDVLTELVKTVLSNKIKK